MAVRAPAAQCKAVRRDRFCAEPEFAVVRVGEVLVGVDGAVVGTVVGVGPEVSEVAVSDVSEVVEVVEVVEFSLVCVEAVVSVESVDPVDPVGSVTPADSPVADVSVGSVDDSVGAVEVEDALGIDGPTSAVPVTVLAQADATRITEHSKEDRRSSFMPAAY